MLSKKVVNNLGSSSWIRAMFEEGERLRKIHGKDKVYDFSIGNPEMEPPFSVKENLKDIILKDEKGLHRYMSNAGYNDVKEKVCEYVNNGLEAILVSKYTNLSVEELKELIER
jgi:aspartate aminotransferase